MLLKLNAYKAWKSMGVRERKPRTCLAVRMHFCQNEWVLLSVRLEGWKEPSAPALEAVPGSVPSRSPNFAGPPFQRLKILDGFRGPQGLSHGSIPWVLKFGMPSGFPVRDDEGTLGTLNPPPDRRCHWSEEATHCVLHLAFVICAILFSLLVLGNFRS